MIIKTLVVDDDSEIHELMRSFLASDAGFAVDFAYQTQDAIEKFETGQPDLVLLDVHMPGPNGFVALRRLRNMASTLKPGCKIIMMTRSKTRADVETALSYGADDYITKPLSLPVLRQKIAGHFPRPKTNGPVQNILIVDDEEDMRALLQAHLKGAGKTLSFASNARRAFEVMFIDSRTDLILLDLNLGHTNGIEFLTQLREQRYRDYAADFAQVSRKLDAIRDVPVIVLTASADQAAIARLQELGISGYLMKPFQKQRLLEVIASVG